MLTEIQADGGDATNFMKRVKDKEPGVRLMGFGHRVYKNYDPRAAIVKKSADSVLSALGGNDELLDLAMGLEEIALSDDYFISRKLYPNVDFYTGLIYKAMGFSEEMFTPLFALGRMPGWIAQWREMMTDPQTKIGRPRQIYTGAVERDYTETATPASPRGSAARSPRGRGVSDGRPGALGPVPGAGRRRPPTSTASGSATATAHCATAQSSRAAVLGGAERPRCRRAAPPASSATTGRPPRSRCTRATTASAEAVAGSGVVQGAGEGRGGLAGERRRPRARRASRAARTRRGSRSAAPPARPR